MAKKFNPIPEDERTLKLIFESAEDVDCFIAAYMDGGCAEHMNYDVDHKESKLRQKYLKTMVLKGHPDRCPKCKSVNVLDQASSDEHILKRIEYFAKGKDLKKQFLCEDCHKNFDLKEEDE